MPAMNAVRLHLHLNTSWPWLHLHCECRVPRKAEPVARRRARLRPASSAAEGELRAVVER